MDAAERHRRHMNERFYDVLAGRSTATSATCTSRTRGSRQTYEDPEPGLAQYVRDAIHANADRAAAQG